MFLSLSGSGCRVGDPLMEVCVEESPVVLSMVLSLVLVGRPFLHGLLKVLFVSGSRLGSLKTVLGRLSQTPCRLLIRVSRQPWCRPAQEGTPGTMLVPLVFFHLLKFLKITGLSSFCISRKPSIQFGNEV